MAAWYWWVSVDFTYKSVTIHPSTIITVVSKNDTLSLDHSVVNLMVGLVDFFYKAVHTFLSMIPKGEYVINVSLPYCWLYSGLGQ